MTWPTDWKKVLAGCVSPLSEGVRPLEVRGWRPVGMEDHRPRRTAAVLVGVIDQSTPEIVLTVRSRHLKNHPGQISFPGGAADDEARD